MALYKIGITEAGDAGVDLSWVEKLDRVDAAVLITKCVSPDFFDAALEHKDRLIVHATITGYGHSALEPNVPTPYEEFAAIMELVKAGFPMEKIVIRIDPIIPTEKGLSVAYRTMISFMEMGFQRYRVSVIDMYPHSKKPVQKAGLPLPVLIAVSLRLKHSFQKWTICCGKQSSSGKGWITAKFSELSPVQNPVLRSRLPVAAFQTTTSICSDFLRMQNQAGLAINERAVCVMQGKLNC